MKGTLQIFAITLGMATLHYKPLCAQKYGIFEIRNCQHEMRTMTFDGQVKFFWHWASGMFHSDIQKQRILQFAPDYKVDTTFLISQNERIRNALPPGFFNFQPNAMGGGWYDNAPDEPAIWFTVVFGKKDEKGNITAYAAYRITFEGNDAHIDQQRMAPRITKLEYIFDKPTLSKLATQLKSLPLAGG